ncbi:Immunoglobulin V-set domain [Trinorchestia longiramus]|nr:Immunoglobulin V-set domain [Trinorchestia longiramus]
MWCSRFSFAYCILTCLILLYPILTYRILTCCVLTCCVLTCCVLTCCVLTCCVLTCCILTCCVLTCCVLTCCVLTCCVLTCCVLTYRGPIHPVKGVKGGRAYLPCDVTPLHANDRHVLVLWYKDGIGTPIHSHDSRRTGGRTQEWSDMKTFGERVRFDLLSTPSSLVLERLKTEDAGLYRCRVDFKRSPTRNARANLTVINVQLGRILPALVRKLDMCVGLADLALDLAVLR